MFTTTKKLGMQAPKLDSGGIEALKWLALICMTIDHINHFLLGKKVPLMYEIGRIAMPLFGFVLAYNLARAEALQRNVHIRLIKCLMIFGLIATPFYGILNRWWPVNILFTLMLATYLIYLLEKNGENSIVFCCLLLVVGGIFVEYLWFTPIYCLAAWWYCKSPNVLSAAGWLLSTALLVVINLNMWAMAAIPIIYLVSQFNFRIPRLKHFFYSYYPIHLATIAIIRHYV